MEVDMENSPSGHDTDMDSHLVLSVVVEPTLEGPGLAKVLSGAQQKFFLEELPWEPVSGAPRSLFSLTDQVEVALLPVLLKRLFHRGKKMIAEAMDTDELHAEVKNCWKHWYGNLHRHHKFLHRDDESWRTQKAQAMKAYSFETEWQKLKSERPVTEDSLASNGDWKVKMLNGKVVALKEISVQNQEPFILFPDRVQTDQCVTVIRLVQTEKEGERERKSTAGILVVVPAGEERRKYEQALGLRRILERKEQESNRPVRLVLTSHGACGRVSRSLQCTFDGLENLGCDEIKNRAAAEFQKPGEGRRFCVAPSSISNITVKSINNQPLEFFGFRCKQACESLTSGSITTLHDVLKASTLVVQADTDTSEEVDQEEDNMNTTSMELLIYVEEFEYFRGEDSNAISSPSVNVAKREEPYPEQASVASRIMNRIKWILKDQGKSLDNFNDVEYLILVPVFTTLLEQTMERAWKHLAKHLSVTREQFNKSQHVLMCQTVQKKQCPPQLPIQFVQFKDRVSTKKNVLFILVVDESHFGSNKNGAQDTFINHRDFVQKDPNLVILQLSATPYCNLTSDSRIPERYAKFQDGDPLSDITEVRRAAELGEWRRDDTEELNVVKWFRPQSGKERRPFSSLYLRLEDLLQTIPSKIRHDAVSRAEGQGPGQTPAIEAPIASRLIRSDDWLEARMPQSSKNGGKEYTWLLDFVFSMMYFSKRWDAGKQNLKPQPDGETYDGLWEQFHTMLCGPNGEFTKLEQEGREKLDTRHGKEKQNRAQGKPKKVKRRGGKESSDETEEAFNERLTKENHDHLAEVKVRSQALTDFFDQILTTVGGDADAAGTEQDRGEEVLSLDKKDVVVKKFFGTKADHEKDLLAGGRGTEDSVFTETDRIVRDLLSVEVRDAKDSEGKPFQIRQGPMIVVRVYQNPYGSNLQRVITNFRDQLFGKTSVAVIHDTGGSSLADSVEEQFTKVPMLHVDPKTKEEVVVSIDGILEDPTKSLKYTDLHGLPCLLILCEKGRMGDTFPHNFKCLDIRIRTSENTTTAVQELGRISRYMSFCQDDDSEVRFSNAEDAIARMTAGKDQRPARQLMGVFKWNEQPASSDDGAIKSRNLEFVGLARSFERWSSECVCTFVQHESTASGPGGRNTDSRRFRLSFSHPTSLEGCRIVKMNEFVNLTKKDKKLEYENYFVFRNIEKHEAGTKEVVLDRPFHETDLHPLYCILRDDGCLRELCSQDKCPAGGVIRILQYGLPYALVTGAVMKELQTAINWADVYDREIWECVRLNRLDAYVVQKEARKRFIISKRENQLHNYRRSYAATPNNADSYRSEAEGADYVHALRIQLAAECQIGKTEAFLHLIRLLQEEVCGGRVFLPELPSPLALPSLASTDGTHSIKEAYGWLMPYWEDICRAEQPWTLFRTSGIGRGKYHFKVKIQRLELLLKILADSQFREKSWEDQAREFVSRVRQPSDQTNRLGEGVQSAALEKQLTDLEKACCLPADHSEKIRRPIDFIFGRERPCFKVLDMDDLARMLDWHFPTKSREVSVFWAKAKNGDPFTNPKQGLIKKHEGVYVLQRALSELSFNVQDIMWSSPKEFGASSSKSAISLTCTRRHPYDASVLLRSEGLRNPRILSLARTMTTIAGRTVHLGELFGADESAWPKLHMDSASTELFEFTTDSLSNTHEPRILKARKRVAESGTVKNWIFTPSHNRHLRSGNDALLERSRALPSTAKAVQLLLVRGEKSEGGKGKTGREGGKHTDKTEFEHYCRDFGARYIIVSLPEQMYVKKIFEKLSLLDPPHLEAKLGAVCEVATASRGGIGYARLFGQVLAYLLQLSRIWFLDDTVLACEQVDLKSMFPLQPPRIKRLISCTFADVMTEIEEQFGDLGGCDSGDSAGVVRDPCTSQLVDLSVEAGAKQLAACPHSEVKGMSTRVAAERAPRADSANPKQAAEQGNVFTRSCLSGNERAYGVVGIRRDPHMQQKNHPPFRVTHSVYSMYLLNVKDTMERGIMYSPKSFWEDIEFNQLCEEGDLAVLKCNRFYHSKSWKKDGSEDDTDDESAPQTTCVITVNVVAGGVHKWEVDSQHNSLRHVWPQVQQRLGILPLPQFLLLNAEGEGQGRERSGLPLLPGRVDGLLDPVSDLLDVFFNTFYVFGVFSINPNVAVASTVSGLLHEQKPKGLANHGNSCYMNSVLQTLMHTPDFAPGVLAATGQGTNLSGALKRLFMTWTDDDLEAFAAAALDVSGFERGRQQDASEFLLCITNHLKETDQNLGVARSFDAKFEVQLKCECCGKRGRKCEETEVPVCLIIKPEGEDYRSVQQAWREHVEVEVDSKCEAPCNGVRKQYRDLLQCPPALAICLKRFESSSSNKLNGQVSFESRFLVRESSTSSNVACTLNGVIAHLGPTLDGGHYVAYIRSGGTWWKMSDDQISQVGEKDVLDLGAEAYMLFYVRDDIQPDGDADMMAENGDPERRIGGCRAEPLSSQHKVLGMWLRLMSATPVLINRADELYLEDGDFIFDILPEDIAKRELVGLKLSLDATFRADKKAAITASLSCHDPKFVHALRRYLDTTGAVDLRTVHLIFPLRLFAPTSGACEIGKNEYLKQIHAHFKDYTVSMYSSHQPQLLHGRLSLQPGHGRDKAAFIIIQLSALGHGTEGTLLSVSSESGVEAGSNLGKRPREEEAGVSDRMDGFGQSCAMPAVCSLDFDPSAVWRMLCESGDILPGDRIKFEGSVGELKESEGRLVIAPQDCNKICDDPITFCECVRNLQLDHSSLTTVWGELKLKLIKHSQSQAQIQLKRTGAYFDLEAWLRAEFARSALTSTWSSTSTGDDVLSPQPDSTVGSEPGKTRGQGGTHRRGRPVDVDRNDSPGAKRSKQPSS